MRVKVFDTAPSPISVYASPLETEVIERLLVSEADRKNAKYDGFSLSISIADLNTRFRLVHTEQK